MSISLWADRLSNNNNGDGACGWYLPIFVGLAAQVSWLGRRVGAQSPFIK